ncbi:MAG: DNA cytosine methyltransferase, partial [Sodaliphilus sp.]|nr:DNA cytosine methyltransferase [Sodaliphilus sp.]
ENMAGSITPHPYSSCLRAGASANYILINDERRPTEREMLRIQGFPDDFKIVVPYSKIKHQTGNSVAVPVIKAVAKAMINALKEYEHNKTTIDYGQGHENSKGGVGLDYKQIAGPFLQANTDC